MRGGRHQHHHPEALTFQRLALLLGILTAPAALVWAAHQKLAPDGTVHRIEVEVFSGARKATGTRLLHVIQRADGSEQRSYVPGTDDLATDREPSLEIDPVNGEPVLVWSRNEGAGFDVYLSRYAAGSWRAPVILAPGGAEDSGPDLRIDRNLIHVVWRRGEGTPWSMMRMSLDRPSQVPVFGPEILPEPGTGVVPPGGETASGSSPEPPQGDAYFAAETSPVLTRRIFIWGIRDVPVPVDYRQGFEVPENLVVEESVAAWMGGRFVLWFTTADRFFYFVRADGRWSDLRIIELSEKLSPADARLLLEENLQR